MLDISVRMGSRSTVTTRSLAGSIGISSTSAGVHGHHQWPHTQEARAHLRLQASVTSVLHSARENRFSSRVALGWKELISRHGRVGIVWHIALNSWLTDEPPVLYMWRCISRNFFGSRCNRPDCRLPAGSFLCGMVFFRMCSPSAEKRDGPSDCADTQS